VEGNWETTTLLSLVSAVMDCKLIVKDYRRKLVSQSDVRVETALSKATQNYKRVGT